MAPFIWISGLRSSEYPAAVCLNIRPQVRPNNWPPFVQIFGRRSSESLVAVRTNIQPPFVHIFGRRSSESPASVRPNIWPMFVRISSLLSSECPATIHPQMRLPFVRLSGHRLSESPAYVQVQVQIYFLIRSLTHRTWSSREEYTIGYMLIIIINQSINACTERSRKLWSIFHNFATESQTAIHTNLRPPFDQISGLRSTKYPASVRPNIRPTFIGAWPTLVNFHVVLDPGRHHQC